MKEFASRGVTLRFHDTGEGIPVIFLHGVWMSSRFFHLQTDSTIPGVRCIALDFRSHGSSDVSLDGHTMRGYAQDVINLLDHLKLQKAVLVGWSMGAFVAWELLKRFGTDRVAGLVVVDESASDFSWPQWGYGVVDALGLSTFHEGIQDAQAEVAQEFAPEMFASLPDQETLQWMVDEMCKLPPAVASSILFAQTLVDYREFLTTLEVPTLLCFGRDEQLVPVAAGEDLATRIKDSKLLVFENSSHCPFLEVPDRFNLVVSQFAGGFDV